MNSSEIRQKYLDFFNERGHAVIPSSSLRPENDPTTLFTGSGMQPLLPYFLGEEHSKGTRVVNSQKCFRAEDIEEVGDNRHTTFFEMLGNWSFGDYFKKEQLPWVFGFLTDVVGLNPQKLYVTAFLGDEVLGIPKDTESADIWKELFKGKGINARDAEIGSEEDGGKRGMKEGERIFYYDSSKNWWSRAGKPENMPAGEPGGPDSEVFYEFTDIEHDSRFGEHCHPNCDCGRFMEIGNSVFMEYLKKEDGSFEPLAQKNVDFGGGLERIAAAANDDADMFKIDSLRGIISEIEKVSGKSYSEEQYREDFRVIADHMRAAVFMIDDGVFPSNTEQGYFVRRLIRRSVMKVRSLNLAESFPLGTVAHIVAEVYKDFYPALKEKADIIDKTITEEETRFNLTLEKGMKEFEKLSSSDISGHDAFVLFTTYGFPLELTEELAVEKGISVEKAAFDEEMERHQELSRAGSEQKFKGGLADQSQKTVEYHTATHLLLAGLRKELGDNVHQAGSNITSERLRFDFTHPEKVDRETLDRIEGFVNSAIKAGAHVETETMKKEDAESDPTVEGSFWEKYPDEVKVYTIRDDNGIVYSRELCGGPHVENTATIRGVFKIVKESSSSAGVRRIKAVLEED
ncbi:MAG: alanine--tRNA ligase [Candidatus Pacebacteria bacterium]|nr:alanine--tRNA ligase [Candidatus Paceibacterota bacterium]